MLKKSKKAKEKNLIREKISRKRRYLTKSEKRQLDENIIKKLESLKEWEKAKTVLVYVSYNSEINTIDLIKRALKSKTVVTPKTHLKFNTLSLHKINTFDDLIKGRHNILEPHKLTEIIKPENIDLALIPGIAFDKQGHRIGHGKAYYDKLNKILKCKKISLAYNFQVLENIPVEKHDEKIDMIITEKNTLNFKL